MLISSYDKKFNGKSWETDLSLNIYDFHARGYMPDIVRTFQQDPLAEKFSNISPYSFLNNNPMYFIDPNGMEAIPPIGFDQEDGAQHTDKDGSWVYNKSTNVWEGKNGAQSYDNMITLSELTINMPDPYEGTYFDKDNKGSGIYGPSTNGYLVAGICAVPLVVVAAEAGLIGAGCSYIYAEGSSLIANFSSSSYFSKAGIDFTTEIIANKGNIGDVNAISVIGAGFGADALSSPFSLSYNRGFERKSLEQTVINYGANKFNGGMQSGVKYLGTNSIFKSGFGQVYTNALSIGVQSVIKNQTSELIDKPNE